MVKAAFKLVAIEVDEIYLTPDVFNVINQSPCLKEQTQANNTIKRISLFIEFI